MALTGQIKDKNELVRRLVWALLTYPDESQFCFQTTLNQDILRSKGIVLEQGCLVRLDKQYYWNGKYIYRQFPFAGAKISLWEQLTYTNDVCRQLHEFM